MIQSQVPDLADGGYWYVVPVYIGPKFPDGLQPGGIPGAGWCAWYGEVNGEVLVAIRTPQPVNGMDTVDATPSAVLAAGGWPAKPHGRVGGA